MTAALSSGMPETLFQNQCRESDYSTMIATRSELGMARRLILYLL
jgi:hypothetical protein